MAKKERLYQKKAREVVDYISDVVKRLDDMKSEENKKGLMGSLYSYVEDRLSDVNRDGRKFAKDLLDKMGSEGL